MRGKSFHIITFGCQMNEHDSERIAGMLEKQGYVPAVSAEQAEMIILNTCSIREKAEQKFYSELGRLRELKAERPAVRIAVSGCIAQQEGTRLLSRAPHVDMVFGPSDIAHLPEMIDGAFVRGRRLVRTGGDADYHLKQIPSSRTDRIRAWVSIMYGCDNSCAYCVVPRLRGRERSRPAAQIIDEVRALAAAGTREVTLLGQNVNSYGAGDAVGFAKLLEQVNGVDGIERVRFVTSHPKDLSTELIGAMRELPKVCEAIHLPVQSGSDRILTAMNRRYTADDYRRKISGLRDAMHGIVITTDVIVGFPGEDDADHERTMDLLRDVEFDGLFGFKYSRRPNTAALGLPNHLPEEVKDARLSEVLAVQRGITDRRNRQYVGTIQEVLVDGGSRRGEELSGRTRGNRVVNFAGPRALLGSIIRVRITRAGANSLTGELCA